MNYWRKNICIENLFKGLFCSLVLLLLLSLTFCFVFVSFHVLLYFDLLYFVDLTGGASVTLLRSTVTSRIGMCCQHERYVFLFVFSFILFLFRFCALVLFLLLSLTFCFVFVSFRVLLYFDLLCFVFCFCCHAVSCVQRRAPEQACDLPAIEGE